MLGEAALERSVYNAVGWVIEQVMQTKSRILKATLPLLSGGVTMVISNQVVAAPPAFLICDLGMLPGCDGGTNTVFSMTGMSFAHGVNDLHQSTA